MAESCDFLIIGAGTAGVYFGWQMAINGYSVVIVEKHEREQVGKRLDVFHIDSDKFFRFGIPLPEDNDPDFCCLLEQGTSYSPEGKYPKVVKYPFHVMRLPLFLQRLFKLAESDGVRFEFKSDFSELQFEDGKIIGALVKKGDEQVEYKSKLVVDSSGINSRVRTSLPLDYGVENFPIEPDEKFYVVLRYITWEDQQKPRTVNSEGWTYYKTWVAPSFDEKGAIIGVGATDSYDHAEEVLEDFFKTIDLPPYTIERIERGVTPYRRPPYSLVGDGFLCLGDSACITKPFSGEGITATWTLCRIAAEVAGDALKQGKRLTKESLWDINVRYFRDQGAKFAGILATVPSAANTSKKENSYLFKKDVIFSEADLTDMNRDFEMKLSSGKILKIFGIIILGLLTGNYSFSNLKALLKSVTVSGKIRSHYDAYPDSPELFDTWADTAEKLWLQAGAKMQ